MTTQYTPILKLALPVTGELSGTWGDVVNDNITSMVEQAIAGLAIINTWTANSHTLTTANGTTSESRCAMLVAQNGAGLAAAGEIVCPASSKLYVLKNDTSYQITLKTSGGTGVAVASGNTAFLFCDGTNVNACVTTIVDGRVTGNLTVDGNATINGNTTLGNATSDTITATARFASGLTPSADNTYDLGSTGNSWKDLYIDGTAYLALVDINGGTIDGVSIGATTPATVINVDNLSLNGNTISSTDTNGNIVIAPNGTGDVQLDADTVRVGDSGAAVTLTSNGAGALTVTTGGAANLVLSTNSGTDSGTITIANGANGNITLTPNGTGDVALAADTTILGDANTDTYLTTNGTGNLNLTTNGGTNSGVIQIAQGANGNITLTPNGTGLVSIPSMTLSGGTANGVAYLNGSKVLTTGSALTFDGQTLTNTRDTPILTLNDTAASNVALRLLSTGGLTYIQSGISAGAFASIAFTANGGGSEQMRLTSTGLGIGTSSPSAKLTVVGNQINTVADGAYAAAFNATTGNVRVLPYSATYAGSALVAYSAGYAGNGPLAVDASLARFLIGGTERMRIDSSGNVGIGTSSPDRKLSIYTTDTTGKMALFSNGNTNTNLYLSSDPSSGGAVFNASNNAASAGVPFLWQLNGSEQMRLTSTGLGIGTSSPGARIQISGAGAQEIRILGDGDASKYNYWTNNNGNMLLGAVSSYGGRYMAFFTGTSGTGTERMRLDADGNLGLGVTPSAWGTYRAMQIGSAGASIFGGSAGIATFASMGSNYYFDGSVNRYVVSAASSKTDFANGTISWYTAPSGTAGNAISFTQAMTLDASGRLAIGATSVTNGTAFGGGSQVNVAKIESAGYPCFQINTNTGGGSSVQFTNSGTVNGVIGYNASGGTNEFTVNNSLSGALTFGTNNTERARIDSSGNLLVGTQSQPVGGVTARLAVSQSAADYSSVLVSSQTTAANCYGARIQYTGAAPNGTGNAFLVMLDTGGDRAIFRSNGGLANYSANDVNLSDRREKTNFAPAGEYLTKICAIPVQTFNYIDQNMEEDPGLTLGVVAQDVQAVAPELVMESDWSAEKDGSKMRLSVYQTDLQYALMKCIQEQQAIINQLKARLDAANL